MTTASRRLLFIGLIVTSSAVAGGFSVWTATHVSALLRTDPDLYAKRNTFRMGLALHLTSEQKKALLPILREHRASMNALEKEELQFWKHRYAEFGTLPEVEWNLRIAETRQITERRLQTRLVIHERLKGLLSQEQQKRFAEFMIQRLNEHLDK